MLLEWLLLSQSCSLTHFCICSYLIIYIQRHFFWCIEVTGRFPSFWTIHLSNCSYCSFSSPAQHFCPLWSPSHFHVILAFVFSLLTASQQLQGFSFCTQILLSCLEILKGISPFLLSCGNISTHSALSPHSLSSTLKPTAISHCVIVQGDSM